MSNKRLSELVELPANNIAADDLFLVTDVNVLESKKVKAESIGNYVLALANTSGAFSHVTLSDTASYLLYTGVYNGTASHAMVAGSAKSSSYALTSSYAINSTTASYILASNIDGALPNATNSDSASYVIYHYDNGTVENSKTASYCEQAKTASYLFHIPGVDNGTVTTAITAANADFATTAYNLVYSGAPNGTASYSITGISALTASRANYLHYGGGNNGTASFAISSSNAKISITANTTNFLNYSPLVSNGTASYAIQSLAATTALSANTAVNSTYAQFSDTASYLNYTGIPNGTASYAMNSKTSSFALIAENINDPALYKIYGPYTSTDSSYGDHTTAGAYIYNFKIDASKIIVEAFGDIKVPISNTDLGMNVKMYMEDRNPDDPSTIGPLDTCNLANYVATATSGALGYSIQSFSLRGSYTNFSSSWYRFNIIPANGALIDTRSVKFLIYARATTFERTTYPPI